MPISDVISYTQPRVQQRGGRPDFSNCSMATVTQAHNDQKSTHGLSHVTAKEKFRLCEMSASSIYGDSIPLSTTSKERSAAHVRWLAVRAAYAGLKEASISSESSAKTGPIPDQVHGLCALALMP